MKRIILLIIMGTALFWGCNTYKKQLNKSTTFFLAHRDALAPLCAQQFPVKDSIGAVTIDSTHKANNVNYQGQIDSLKAVADALRSEVKQDTNKSNPCAVYAKAYQEKINSLSDQVSNLKIRYKACTSDTLYKTKTLFRVDSALVVALRAHIKARNDSLNIMKGELKNEKETSSSRLKWIFILGGIIGLSILGTVLKILGKI